MRRASLLFAVLLLAACGSSNPLGDLGTIFGSQAPTNPSSVNGVVTGVDTNAQRIDLNVTYVNNLRPSSSQSSGSVYYDSNTRVVYQGNNYAVTDLERGDEVSVNGANNNGRYVAQTITVTRNVRG
ncbi:MAG TPA: hypothetical protein VF980_18505 [Thermoanaerobaculia bacterium]